MRSLFREGEMMDLMEEFKTQKWWTPFPMGVFGTLRQGWGNHRLLRGFSQSHRAFMPHFQPVGLHIDYHHGSSGVFEIFSFTPENWRDMIGRVDCLEGFSPDNSHREWGYWRTLVHLHILPDDFPEDLWQDASTRQVRDLKIPMTTWNQFPKIPCWVYSSRGQNQLCEQASPEYNPVIWYGE